MPRLKGRESTVTPSAAATAAVRSVEPSSTTITSRPGRVASSRSTAGRAASSLKAGMITRVGVVPGLASDSLIAPGS